MTCVKICVVVPNEMYDEFKHNLKVNGRVFVKYGLGRKTLELLEDDTKSI